MEKFLTDEEQEKVKEEFEFVRGRSKLPIGLDWTLKFDKDEDGRIVDYHVEIKGQVDREAMDKAGRR